jgi:hypothetical protein
MQYGFKEINNGYLTSIYIGFIEDSESSGDRSSNNLHISTIQISESSFGGLDIESKIKSKMVELKLNHVKNDDKSFLDISGFNMDNRTSFLDYTIDHGKTLIFLIIS